MHAPAADAASLLSSHAAYPFATTPTPTPIPTTAPSGIACLMVLVVLVPVCHGTR